MDEKLIEEIVRLDELLMKVTMSDYDPARRRQGLIKELNEGAVIIPFRNNKNDLRSYIEFLEKEDHMIYVPSFQKSNNILSRSFIKKIYDYLEHNGHKIIKSSVHKNNKKSLGLHRKLGFQAKETEDRIIFEIEVQRILKKIKHLI